MFATNIYTGMVRLHFQIIEELGYAVYGDSVSSLDSTSQVRGLRSRRHAQCFYVLLSPHNKALSLGNCLVCRGGVSCSVPHSLLIED